jgi:hypothetical protein
MSLKLIKKLSAGDDDKPAERQHQCHGLTKMMRAAQACEGFMSKIADISISASKFSGGYLFL